MATVKMTGIINFRNNKETRLVVADIHDSKECIEQALKDGFKFTDEKDKLKAISYGIAVED